MEDSNGTTAKNLERLEDKDQIRVEQIDGSCGSVWRPANLQEQVSRCAIDLVCLDSTATRCLLAAVEPLMAAFSLVAITP